MFTTAAHRGASVEFPPNTLEAFWRAVEIFPDCLLETDIRKTRDGRAVILHDSSVAVKTDGKGFAKAHSLEEIKQLDAGYKITFDGGKTFPFRGKGFRIPALEEVLREFPGSLFSFDIKDNDPVFARRVMVEIGKHGAMERVIMGSFHPRIVINIRREFPEVATSFQRNELYRFLFLFKTGLSRLYRPAGDVLMIPEFYYGGSSEYRPNFRFRNGIRIVTRRFIDSAHDMGLPLMVWTINDGENMKRLIDWGVDGIVTDYPDLLRQVLREIKV